MLFKYIFVKAYLFCYNVIKEREFPEYFASLVLAFVITTNLYLIIYSVEYALLPVKIDFLMGLPGLFALVIWGLIIIYVSAGGKYKRFINEMERSTQKKILRIIAVVYIVVLVCLYSILTILTRQYNL